MAGEEPLMYSPFCYYIQQDEPGAEGTVRNVSTWITAALRNEQFFSLAELNSAIREKLEQFNANTFQKKKVAGVVCFLGKKCHYWQRCLLPGLNSAIGKPLPFSLIITLQ